MQHVVIAGGGVVGLACALELAQAGFQVSVLEQGRVMEGASWAAAGMLAVEDPENPPALLPLARFSRSLYPEFLAHIEKLSGMAVPLRTAQTLQVTHAGEVSLPCESQMGSCGFNLLEEASLDPRDLCRALPHAAKAAGAMVHERVSVRSVQRRKLHVSVERSGGNLLEVDYFVLAGGAWSGLLSLPNGPELPVAPRKGQMIEVTLTAPALPVVVRTPELYLVPRGDGRIVIGATVEHAGFDRSVDETAGDRLLAAAGLLWPPILRGRITGRWTGLRPGYRQGVPDALPVIGQVDEGVWVATGHFRNGILLAPGTAHVLRQLLLGQPPSVDLAAFSPERFAQQPELAPAAH